MFQKLDFIGFHADKSHMTFVNSNNDQPKQVPSVSECKKTKGKNEVQKYNILIKKLPKRLHKVELERAPRTSLSQTAGGRIIPLGTRLYQNA